MSDEKIRSRDMLLHGSSVADAAKATGLPEEVVKKQLDWLRGDIGKDWIRRNHPEVLKPAPEDNPPPPAVRPQEHLIPENKVPTARVGGAGTQVVTARGSQVLVLDLLGKPEVRGEVEIPNQPLTAKNIKLDLTPVTIMWMNYGRSIGYDQPDSQFIEDVVVGFFRDRGVTMGIVKREDNLRALLGRKDVKVFVVSEGGNPQ